MAESAVIPQSVVDSAKTTLQNIEQVEAHLTQLLSLSGPDSLTELPPLERAQLLLLLAKATTTLFALRLRCSGVDVNDHPVKTELERISLYEDKYERMMDMSKAPLRPSTTLNYQAATRVIEHSLPDLTQEQRQSMRDISREQGPKIKYSERNASKKRKYQSQEKQSVQSAAKEFLEKAARELLGDNKESLKGPLMAESSDDDTEPMS